MTGNILVVDDEKEIADLVELFLINEGYTVYKSYSGNSASMYIENEQIDLAILDIMLPDKNGIQLCQKIREKYNYPVIMLTAKSNETDQITGLAIGADDYVTKPFKPLTLMARVKAQLRRHKNYNCTPVDQNQSKTRLEHLGLILDTGTHECHVNDKPIQLTPTEFQILEILLTEKGKVVSSEAMFRRIWANEYYTKNNNTIAVHVRHLREKIEDTAGDPRYIKTIWGLGYKIEI